MLNLSGSIKKRTIYLVRKQAIGDVLWIEPVIKALATQYKRVIVLTRFPELFENYPYKNVVFRSKISLLEKLLIKTEKRFGISFFSINLNKSYEEKPLQHILHAYQQKAGLPITNDLPALYLSENELQKDAAIKGKYVVLHIEERVVKKNTRRIYGIDWAAVAEYLNEKGYQVIEVGSGNSEIANIVYKPTKTIRELISTINQASFFMGIDSGPAHIAAALHKPVILFFGSVNPDFRFFKETLKGFILQHYCQFAGCYHTAKEPTTLTCRVVGEEGIPPCADFSTQEVLLTIDKLIEQNKEAL